MDLAISTSNGTSKVIYKGTILGSILEGNLESLRSDIWIALMEMEIVKGRLCTMCGEHKTTDQGVCNDCSIGCEMTCHEYDRMEEVL